MTSDYENIYSRFLLKITDPRLAGMDENIAKDMMGGWMRSTVSRPYVRRLFSSINLDDGME